MPFTAQELSNIANSSLDFYFNRGKVEKQAVQDRPMYDKMKSTQKTFPGGKENISGAVKGDYTTAFQGFSQDDTVAYGNPANTKRFNFPWKELHSGISLTLTELKIDGISVVDSLNGEKTTEHSDREMTAIANIMEEKLDDMVEGSARSFNSILWQDGTQSPKVFAGITAFVRDNPLTGLVGGIDAATNVWWRNRAALNIAFSESQQTLSKTLREEVRLLRRFGGRPSVWVGGNKFIKALEREVSEKGIYTQQGFTNKGATDIGLATISMKGVGDCIYDPTLDDLGRSNYGYLIDPNHLFLDVMDGEDNKVHAPARPAEKYVLFRAMTWTGALIANKLNCHGVYSVAGNP